MFEIPQMVSRFKAVAVKRSVECSLVVHAEQEYKTPGRYRSEVYTVFVTVVFRLTLIASPVVLHDGVDPVCCRCREESIEAWGNTRVYV